MQNSPAAPDESSASVDPALERLLTQGRRFLLTGHEHPDGDCLGAEVALYHLLRSLGKEVVVVNPDPVTRNHEFLLRHTPIQAHQAERPLPLQELDAAVLLDCAQLSRLGTLGPRLRASGATIAVIDHHVGSEAGDGEVMLVDSSAPSTGALIYELHRHLEVPLSAAAAEGVFLSLVADTGWFRYSNTDARVLRIASELVAQGVDASQVFDQLFRRNHPESVELLTQALSTVRRRLGDRFLFAVMDRAAMDRASRIGFETDQVLDPMRSVEGVEVTGLFKERFDGDVRVSLRASGDVDVQAIARLFGGGGHRKAAGAVLRLPLERAIAAVEEQVTAALGGGTAGGTPSGTAGGLLGGSGDAGAGASGAGGAM